MVIYYIFRLLTYETHAWLLEKMRKGPWMYKIMTFSMIITLCCFLEGQSRSQLHQIVVLCPEELMAFKEEK